VKARLLALAAAALLVAPVAASADSGGTVAGLRVAVTRMLDAELARDGATACGILDTPLTGTVGGRTCAQRWDARFAHALARHGGRRRVMADLRAATTASVSVSGDWATIALPAPLLDGTSRFHWINNCWMLSS